jgi:uncharacterized protein YjbI with pentapeptide repeats
MTTPAQRKLVQQRLTEIRSANHARNTRFQTGFSGKTSRDRIQLLLQVIGAFAIPISIIGLFIGVIQFNAQQHSNAQQALQQQQHDTRQALDQQQQSTLETYLDRMSDLLFTDKLAESKQGDEVRSVARARTLAALQNLNATRKGILLQFLYESGLIKNPQPGVKAQNPIVDMSSANLEGVDLSHTDLEGIDLSHAVLKGANLDTVNLNGANLNNTGLGASNLINSNLMYANLNSIVLGGANLSHTDMTGSDLSGAYLVGADLEHAELVETDLGGAILDGADLRGATVAPRQLNQAFSLHGTIMPNGSKHP